MGRFCVIGLGNFGFHMARELYADNHEVIAIDMNRERVQRISNDSSYAILGDAANKEFLAGQGIAEMDAVIVSTGERSHLATLITLYLKELKVKNIVVKAVNEDHGRILDRVGAHEVIFPEKDMAVKIATNLSRPNVLDTLELGDNLTIAEIAPPASFIGKSLIELDLRKKHNINVIAIKDVLTDVSTTFIDPNHQLRDSDLLVLIGNPVDIEKIDN